MWVYTVCLDLSVQTLKVITVVWSNRSPKKFWASLLKNHRSPLLRSNRTPHRNSEPLSKEFWTLLCKLWCVLHHITKTRLFKYTENFTTKKWQFFRKKNSDIFHITAQNIDCGYSLEPPRRGGSNEYPQSMFLSRSNKNNVYPCKPQFYYIKVGFKGVKII